MENMFNGSSNLGNDARVGNGNTINGSEFQLRVSHNPANTNPSHSLLGNSAYHGVANSNLLMRSSQAAQHQLFRDSFPQPGQNQALAQTLSAQQQRLLAIRKREIEAQQMANNIKESILINRRLESIKNLQQHEANKLRAELQLKAAVQQATSPRIGGHSSISNMIATKTLPSNSNSSVIPTKRREDEMTKPDLSTLAETAVAIASATAAANDRTRNRRNNNNGVILGVGNMIEIDRANTSDNNQIAGMLGRRASSSAPSTIGFRGAGSLSSRSMSHVGIAKSISNNATMDALRRESNSTIQKLHQKHNLKRSIDDIVKGNTSSPTWLLNSSSVGSSLDSSSKVSLGQLRNHHHNQQFSRRNSLPVTSSDLASATSLKRQRLLEQKVTKFGGQGLSDAMEQMRQLDNSMKMNLHRKNQSAQLAQLAAQMTNAKNTCTPSSSSSSIASASVTGSSLNSFHSPPTRSNHIMMDSAGSMEDRISALNKLNKLGGGFPMPKFFKRKNVGAGESVASAHDRQQNGNTPAEITPDCDKDVVNVMGSKILSVSRNERDQQPQEINHQLRYLEKIGGFPMPPLYRQNVGKQDGNDVVNEVPEMERDRYDNATSHSQSHVHNNAISNHIKNTVNCTTTRAARPPALDRYKQLWREIRVVAGDDPQVDERLRKEVFARKLARGKIFVGRSSEGIALTRNANVQIHQRRPSDISQSNNTSDIKNSNDDRTISETD
eukprot:CAMPEP_0172369276 /NCGR_PEP_ID=MMETSP1060-20121228/31908_1 /TAXON_ID=37318 /ORGANISM="Pseudo-nitzschia pungens, Strain cf. cingulata" /LENGTH=723 /DNA_ID=CAMNT_0013094149 /DNA_START=208 /DNA_END=2379 /DNA_ORIENTATION=-